MTQETENTETRGDVEHSHRSRCSTMSAADYVSEVKRQVKKDREWREYPVGTKARAIRGGHWYKMPNGWKWNGPNGNGGTFPTPGGDASGFVILPL